MKRRLYVNLSCLAFMLGVWAYGGKSNAFLFMLGWFIADITLNTFNLWWHHESE